MDKNQKVEFHCNCVDFHNKGLASGDSPLRITLEITNEEEIALIMAYWALHRVRRADELVGVLGKKDG